MDQLHIRPRPAWLDPIPGSHETELLQAARDGLLGGYDAMTDAQRQEFDEIVLQGIRSAENTVGEPLTNEELDALLYDPATGLPH